MAAETSPPPEPTSGKPANQAVSAGRGVLYIAIAKLYFMIAGFAIEVVLPRLLGLFGFGSYVVVNAWVSNINNVMVTGTIQAVSRYTTADPDRADEVKAAGLRMHLQIGLPLAILYAALAPLWAYFEHDPGKIGPMALSGVIVGAYAFYTVFVGSANGTRAFRTQATLDMTSATLRVAGLLGTAAIGLGLWGAIGGWAAAAVAILLVAAFRVGMPRDRRAGDVAPMRRYLGGLALYLIIMNLIMSVDQMLLKRLSTEWFLAHAQWFDAHPHWFSLTDVGDLAQAAAREADGQVAYYRAVQNLARLPYQLMLAVTFVIFPLVSRAVFEKDAERTRSYIRTTLRYSFVFAALMGSVLAAHPAAMIRVMYTADYAATGGLSLVPLALGSVMFAIFTIAGTILNGAGRTGWAVAVAAVTLGALVIGLWIGIPRATPGVDMLLTCGVATGAAMAVGAIASLWLLWRTFRAMLPFLTVLRVALATAALVIGGRYLPDGGKILSLAEAVACAIAFVAILAVTGELGRADLAALRRRKGA